MPDARGGCSRRSALPIRDSRLSVVQTPNYDEPRMIGIDDRPVGVGDIAVRGHWDVLQRYRIVDVAADHIDRAGPDRDDHVAMPREAAGRQVGVTDWLSGSRVAGQIATLRRGGLPGVRRQGPPRGPARG